VIAKIRCLVLMGLLLSCVSVTAEVGVSAGYIYAPVPGQSMTAAYWQLDNQANTEARLLEILVPSDSPWAKKVEVHQHEHHGGMMRMQRVDEFVLAADAQELFEPGGYHLMVFGVKALSVGNHVPVVLRWQHGEQQVLLEVRQR
jgi:periplasmic copper chaperone A